LKKICVSGSIIKYLTASYFIKKRNLAKSVRQMYMFCEKYYNTDIFVFMLLLIKHIVYDFKINEQSF